MRRHDCARGRAHKTISARDEKTTDQGTWPPNCAQHRSLATAAGRGTTQGVPWCWNPGCVRARCRKQRETSASRNPETGRNALRGVRPWRNSEQDAVRIEAETRDAQELQGIRPRVIRAREAKGAGATEAHRGVLAGRRSRRRNGWARSRLEEAGAVMRAGCLGEAERALKEPFGWVESRRVEQGGSTRAQGSSTAGQAQERAHGVERRTPSAKDGAEGAARVKLHGDLEKQGRGGWCRGIPGEQDVQGRARRSAPARELTEEERTKLSVGATLEMAGLSSRAGGSSEQGEQ
jgi:hypothetical protein